MKKYKVEYTHTNYYVLDVLANTEEEATTEANKHHNKLTENNIIHHHEVQDPIIEVSTIYDVTDTDDPFSPLNE